MTSVSTPSTKTKYSVLEAATVIGKHRNTITRHMGNGKLSFDIDGSGKKIIDATELHRVYGDAFDPNREEGANAKVTPPAKASDNEETRKLRKELDEERSIRRRQDKERIDFLEQSLETALQNQSQTVMLLEDRSKENSKTVERLREINAEQKERMREIRESQRKQIEELRSALKAEQQKAWWQRLTGR